MSKIISLGEFKADSSASFSHLTAINSFSQRTDTGITRHLYQRFNYGT